MHNVSELPAVRRWRRGTTPPLQQVGHVQHLAAACSWSPRCCRVSARDCRACTLALYSALAAPHSACDSASVSSSCCGVCSNNHSQSANHHRYWSW